VSKLRAHCVTLETNYASVAYQAALPVAVLPSFAWIAEKSPRSAFSAYFSASISRRVRTPLRRRTAADGDHLARHGSTRQGIANYFLFTNIPSTVPVKKSADEFSPASILSSVSQNSFTLKPSLCTRGGFRFTVAHAQK
jgi:hypothetical protein